VQSAWTAAQGTETFEIIRRRLFQELDADGEKAREQADSPPVHEGSPQFSRRVSALLRVTPGQPTKCRLLTISDRQPSPANGLRSAFAKIAFTIRNGIPRPCALRRARSVITGGVSSAHVS
jgi:hypothetical protein